MKERVLLVLATAIVTSVALLPASWAGGTIQPPGDIRDLKLRDWEPKSMMVTKTTIVEKPLVPAVDVHNHLGGGKARLTPQVVKRYLTEMDEAGVRTVINLDGGWGEKLTETLEALDNAHPGRFLTFALLNFEGVDEPDWGNREAKRLEESFAAGAKGLKIHKTLGLTIRYRDGRVVPVDDPKLDPVWEACGKHSRPVVIHVADPAAFFTPLDRFNERWHELNNNPGWLFADQARFPKRQDILDQLHRVIGKHPKTTFVNTHFGNNAEDLAAVAEKLDQYPNMFIDVDARISELGRQPYSTRKFFLKYQDRIMFGTDTPPNREAYRIYYRFLETEDEYFDCSASHHRQGFWNIYGINLPPEVLDKVYRRNAERVMFGVKKDDAKRPGPPELRVKPTEDFEVTGDGSAAAWKSAEWVPLNRRGDGHPYETRVKVLSSKKGLYVLMDATDKQLTAKITEDFQNLWTEDVFEVFLWPEERDTIYFEYEISPLGRELPILVPNLEGKFLGWLPWHYEGTRKTRKATAAVGGELKSGAEVKGWRAEVFIPFELMSPLRNVPPKAGTRWRANFYRMDYDGGKQSSWDWARVGPSFHEFAKFGTLVFE
jgi:predicted TIM-barrel fold metal-dependent hydrolase